MAELEFSRTTASGAFETDDAGRPASKGILRSMVGQPEANYFNFSAADFRKFKVKLRKVNTDAIRREGGTFSESIRRSLGPSPASILKSALNWCRLFGERMVPRVDWGISTGQTGTVAGLFDRLKKVVDVIVRWCDACDLIAPDKMAGLRQRGRKEDGLSMAQNSASERVAKFDRLNASIRETCGQMDDVDSMRFGLLHVSPVLETNLLVASEPDAYKFRLAYVTLLSHAVTYVFHTCMRQIASGADLLMASNMDPSKEVRKKGSLTYEDVHGRRRAQIAEARAMAIDLIADQPPHETASTSASFQRTAPGNVAAQLTNTIRSTKKQELSNTTVRLETKKACPSCSPEREAAAIHAVVLV